MMNTKIQKPAYKSKQGFTIVELIIVVVIMAIAAALAVPMMSSAADLQIRTASNMVAADIEYAKNLAVSRQKNHAIVLNSTNDSYDVRVYNSATTSWDVIEHPTKTGTNLSVSFPNDNRLSSVDMTTVDFQPNGNTSITFDYLGSPYSGLGTTNPLNSGQIVLSASGFNMTIIVQPVTGYVTIQ